MSRQRRHRPFELGPRIYRRGCYWHGDFRPWGGTRCTLRNPDSPDWPDKGPRTIHQDIADHWRWNYVDHLDPMNKSANGRVFIVPQRQYQILGALHPSWPFRGSVIAEKAGISTCSIYQHMQQVDSHGWVNIEMIDTPQQPVPQYRISELGLAALEYGRREREADDILRLHGPIEEEGNFFFDD